MLLQITEPGNTKETDQRSENVAIGIDLGTTHSVMAFIRDNVPQIIPSAEGDHLIPSVVSYIDQDVLVGKKAAEQTINCVRSIKRLMGRGSEDLQKLQNLLPFTLQKDQKEDTLLKIDINGHLKSAIDISAEILKKLKHDAELYLKHPVTQAVITVPAYFDEAQRAATKDAARLAGIDVLRLLSEPTAAALAYGLDQNKEGIYAIYDLGGGTFDISILKLDKGVFRVLATGGNAAMGGDDIDHLIAQDFLTKNNITLKSSDDLNELLQKAKALKEALTFENEAKLNFFGQEYVLSRTTFNQLIQPIVTESLVLFKNTLKDAELSAKDLNGIVLVGGTTRIPAIQKAIETEFGQQPLSHLDPDEIVALGAAIQAHGLTKGSDHLLLDVIPLSLGIETMGGIVEKIIDRNSLIPISKAQQFTTYVDGQTAMSLHIVQGERELAKDCRSLAHFELTNIPPMSATLPRIQVTFTIDADGLLTVSALEESTEQKQEIIVKPSYGLTEEEMTQMLFASMEHGKQDIETRLLIEAKVEAESVLAALEKALLIDKDVLTNEEKNEIVLCAQRLSEKLQSTNRDEIQEALQLLEAKTQPFIEKRLNKALASSLKGTSINKF